MQPNAYTLVIADLRLQLDAIVNAIACLERLRALREKGGRQLEIAAAPREDQCHVS